MAFSSPPLPITTSLLINTVNNKPAAPIRRLDLPHIFSGVIYPKTLFTGHEAGFLPVVRADFWGLRRGNYANMKTVETQAQLDRPRLSRDSPAIRSRARVVGSGITVRR